MSTINTVTKAQRSALATFAVKVDGKLDTAATQAAFEAALTALDGAGLPNFEGAVDDAITALAAPGGRAPVPAVVMTAALSLAQGRMTEVLEWAEEVKEYLSANATEITKASPWSGNFRYSTTRGQGGGIRLGK